MKLFSTTSWKYCPTVAQLNTKRSDIQKIFTKRSHKHLPKIYPHPENQVILPKSSTHTTPPLHVRMRNQLYFYGLPISNVTTFLNFVLPHKSLSITWNMSQFYTTEAVISFCGQIFYPTNENVIVSFWVLS